MGFLKNIGGFLDSLDEVTDGIYKDLSKGVKRKAKTAGRVIDTVFDVADDVCTEVSKGVDKGLKNAGKFIDENYKYVEAIADFAENTIDVAIETAWDAAGKAVSFVVNAAKQLIDIIFIKEQVQIRKPDALKAIILEKKKNAVDVGIFSKGEMTERITINSDIGVSNDIYKGQVIEINT